MGILILIAMVLGAGVYYYAQGQNDRIEVKKGYAKLTYNVTNLSISPRVNKTVHAITTINGGEGIINLSVRLYAYAKVGGGEEGGLLFLVLNISTQASLTSDLMPSECKIQATEPENSHSEYDFEMSSVLDSPDSYSNITPWQHGDVPGACAPYTAYTIFTPNESHFGIKHIDLDWKIYDYKTLKTHTLRLENICIIQSEKISATIDVIIDTSHIGEVSE